MGCGTSKGNVLSKTQKINEKSIRNSSKIEDVNNTLSQKYNLKQIIGHGNSGKVVFAESVETKKPVAIKIIPKQNNNTMSEIKILSKMNHPNIVKYFHHYQSEENLYMIMEHCSGGDLFQKLIDNEKLSENETKIIIKSLLEAVNHFHNQGIIHRDLKPENIMYSSEGVIKVIDFGLSMKTENTSQESLVGTSYYIAPEIVKTETFTKACDMWSLGIIFHAMLVGYLPIGGVSFDEICNQIKAYKGPNFDSDDWINISDEAKDLLKKMLDPDYKSRITASAALKHNWFNTKRQTDPLRNKVLKALKNYSEFSELKRNILETLAMNIDDIEVIEFQKFFIELVKNKFGLITAHSLEKSLKDTECKISKNKLENIIRKINRDGEANLDYTCFIAAIIGTTDFLTEEKLESYFKLYNLKDQGSVMNESSSTLSLSKDDQSDSRIQSYYHKEMISFKDFRSILIA